MNDALFLHYKIAIEAVLAASEAILTIYNREFNVQKKDDGSPVTNADLSSAKIIRSFLEKTNLPITDEESTKEPYSIRKKWTKVWCVDPLDGTKEFVKKNDEFVINIALIEKQNPIFGLIASPVYRKIILGHVNYGAFQFSYDDAFHPNKWRKLKLHHTIQYPIKVISSRSHFSGAILKMIQALEVKSGKVNNTVMGSALKFFSLVNQKAVIYPRNAPTMEWDIAAGQAIYEAIGGKVIDVETKKPLIYNKESLYNPFFVAYHPALESILAEL